MTDESRSPTNDTEQHLASTAGWLVGPVLLLLAAWFLWGPSLFRNPLNEPVHVDRDAVSTAPLRVAMTDPAQVQVGPYEYRCMECHRLFPSLSETARRLTEHGHIKLDHGLNDRCFNCHDNENRNMLILAGGKTVPFAESSMSCGQCHGPTYRDWERGMHGRTVGHWDEAFGPIERLSCVECHDPHAPAFAPMSLLPGPNTLRMGVPSKHDADHAPTKRNPLRHWSTPHAAAAEEAH